MAGLNAHLCALCRKLIPRSLLVRKLMLQQLASKFAIALAQFLAANHSH